MTRHTRNETDTLEVFILPGYRGCRRASALVREVAAARPNLDVRLVDLSLAPEGSRESVFPVPAYQYRGQTIFLGNPTLPELEARLDQLGEGEGAADGV